MLAAANQLLPRWVALALVIAVAWQLANLISLLMPGSPSGDLIVAPRTQLSASSRAAADQVNVQTIAESHIFGEASLDALPVPDVLPQQNHENLAETRLNLSLKGTIAYVDQESSIAIIADSNSDEKIYSIRDTVIAGTTLHAVYSDRVVLNTGGTLEALKLPKDFPKGTRQPTRRAPAVARNDENDDGSDLQTEIAQNVTKLADIIRPTPYFVAGQMQGYRVYPGRDRKQFAALGLRPGDLIKDVDGAALTNPQQATQIFQNLGEADQVSVTVERNGQPQVLILKTGQLDLDDEN